MEKSGSIECWGRMRQSVRLILTAITIITWSTFDQVLAAPAERIFPPHELIDHRQFGGGVIQPITPRTDAALHGDAVDFVNSTSGRDGHALEPYLARAPGGEVQKLSLRTHGFPSAIVKENAFDLHKQMAASRTAHVLDLDGHWKGIASFNHVLPLVDQSDGNDHTPRSHAFIEVLDEYQQVPSGDFIRAGGKGVSLGGALIGFSGGPQALSGNPVRRDRVSDRLLGQSKRLAGRYDPVNREARRHHDKNGADKAKPYLETAPLSGIPRRLRSIPLGAKVTLQILLIGLVGLLYWIGWRLLGWGLRYGWWCAMITALVVVGTGSVAIFGLTYTSACMWNSVCFSEDN